MLQSEVRPSSASAGNKKAGAHPKTIGFDAGNKSDDRMAFVAGALVGHKVTVEVASGTVYEGILHSLQPRNKTAQVRLSWAKPIKGPESASQATPVKEVVIKAEDLVQIHATEVDLSPEALTGPTNGAAAFGTDSEISKGRGGVERELTKWEPEGPMADLSLDMPAGKGGRGGGRWDQFEANRKMFKVKSTWDENLYTTKLDRTKVAISSAEADRLAREIESSSASNRHLTEERNQSRDTGEEIDEEELYSAVARGEAIGEEDNCKIDAANSATFGDMEASSAGATDGNNGAVGRGAWGNAGAGVAAVKGVHRLPELERPGKVRTQPIAVDHRKEVNNIRRELTAGGKSKDRSSPSSYGTPKGLSRSPLSSPLLQGLNLEPGQPHMLRDKDLRKEFAAFKASRDKSDRSFSHGMPGSAGSSFKGSDTHPLSPGESLQAEGTPAAGPSAPRRSFSFSSETSAAAAQPPPPSTTPSLTPPTASSRPSDSGHPPRPSASKLNPDAKAFSFNPAAKEFKPSFSAATTPAATPFGTPAATPPATPGGASVSSMSGLSGFRTSSIGSGFAPASQWLTTRGHSHTSPAGPLGRRGSDHGAGRMGEREQGRSRDAEAGRRGGPRERSSDSGFRSESGGSSRFSSGALPPMGSSGLPLSPSQGPLPGGFPGAAHSMGAQWMQQQYVPGQHVMPMMPQGHGSPQQGPMMPFVPRPGYGGPSAQMVPMRPGQVPQGMQFMPSGGIMFAPPPAMHGSPGMQSNPGSHPPQMYHPAMMQHGGPGMPLMPMGGPGGPRAPADGHLPGASVHSSPEQRGRAASGQHSFQGHNQHQHQHQHQHQQQQQQQHRQ